MADPRLDELARILVRYSVDAQPGEFIPVMGDPVARPLMLACYRELMQVGARPMILADFNETQRLFFDEAPAELLTWVNPVQRQLYEQAAGMIRIDAPTNTRHLSGVDPSRIVAAQRARRELMQIMLKRKWVLLQYPTEALAQDAAMSLEAFEAFLYGATNVDWSAFKAAMAPWRSRLEAGDELHVVGPGTDLRLRVGGRRWELDAGENNMPGGEIFTGPIEDSAEGHITFSFPSIYSGREVEGIRLEFRRGRVVGATAARGQDVLDAVLDTDEGARYLGEIGIGLSPGIDRFVRSILFDEKIKGTIHLAVGASYEETGGRNQSATHWDMICDLRQGGEIRLDGQLIQRDGVFVSPEA